MKTHTITLVNLYNRSSEGIAFQSLIEVMYENPDMTSIGIDIATVRNGYIYSYLIDPMK